MQNAYGGASPQHGLGELRQNALVAGRAGRGCRYVIGAAEERDADEERRQQQYDGAECAAGVLDARLPEERHRIAHRLDARHRRRSVGERAQQQPRRRGRHHRGGRRGRSREGRGRVAMNGYAREPEHDDDGHRAYERDRRKREDSAARPHPPHVYKRDDEEHAEA